MNEPEEDRNGTTGKRPVATPYRWSFLEPVVFVGLAFVYIWFLKPTGDDRIRVPYLAIVVLIPMLSNLLHRDRLPELGLRLDNLRISAREVGIVTAAGALLVIGIGLLTGGPHPWSGMWEGFFTYPAWALAQQYAMQAFTLRRMREVVPSSTAAAALTAFLFGIVHAPNVALALVTAVGGYVWCRLFLRHPNLLTLAISHGWLAVLARVFWPAEWLRNLRIGPAFFTWTP